MQVIVATDIFGYTHCIDRLVELLSRRNISSQVIDPYQNEQRFFTDKGHAYQSFVKECGYHDYTQYVGDKLAVIKEPTALLGFSAGASAAWRAADGLNDSQLTQIIGFYPTQIRHHLGADIQPPTQLILPRSEDHFNVDELACEVSKRPNVLCIRTQYGHGFMNPICSGYSQAGYETFCKWLQVTLNKDNKLAHP